MGGSLNQEWLLLKSYLDGYDLIAGLLQHRDHVLGAGPGPAPGPGDPGGHRGLSEGRAPDDALPLAARGWNWVTARGATPHPPAPGPGLAYLLKSDLALYVISSRVGLRQADFQFFRELKRMGLAPHILSLLNLDLGEHTSFEELDRIRERVRRNSAPGSPRCGFMPSPP